ncbi:hypothetical protein [Mariniradius sediminis]|uniref:Uncharacterized protein n=1 Tax=Mariniradius sediminis TaxID=2909237 RepID=A0ABS9BVG4_9BACT|nr:hypothetical protein [Mariniradius sediminis]MCF1752013.1 hypothetical protein [Mariniradius sediminis]
MVACCERKWDRNPDFGERSRSAFSAGWQQSALTTSANTLSTETGSMKNTGTHGLQNVAAKLQLFDGWNVGLSGTVACGDLSFSVYYGYKQASFGIKSMFYTYLYW